MKRLNDGPWVTRSGRTQWSVSIVHHVLSDPRLHRIAYANRFTYVVPDKPEHGRAALESERRGDRAHPINGSLFPYLCLSTHRNGTPHRLGWPAMP